MLCANCGLENLPGSKFCRECGGPLARACPTCETAALADAKFCSECGTTLTPVGQTTPAAPTPARVPAPSPPADSRPEISGAGPELRHVSVLFCDLVGFTPLAEKRDPEEVREVLSGYFELARAIVGRYGGVVQKFIGDAVMAVWGAPIAKEDDAERAVRAGLELASAVAAYGSEHGTNLQARVGIVTGGAATTETAEEGPVSYTHLDVYKRQALNEEYVRWFPSEPPTRYVAKLGVEMPGLLVSIRMTAFIT